MPPALTPPVFSILAALIEERTGLHYETAHLPLFAEKLTPRVMERGGSFLDYYYYLRYDPDTDEELRALVEQLVVNETYFFRELEPLKALVNEVLAPMVARGERPRVWSAACSTGEEPLTLAMLLADRGILASVEILASDVSARALARAREGQFGVRTLRVAPPPELQAWLSQKDGRVVVHDEIRARVRWLKINLVDEAGVKAVGEVDVILCRNVLIYFSDETIRKVISHLKNVLTDDGYLLIGISESLLRLGTALRCEEKGGSFFYRKAA